MKYTGIFLGAVSLFACTLHGMDRDSSSTAVDPKLAANHELANRASEELIQKITKTCSGCGARIEKTMGGCNHMRCICLREFCWLCLKDWDGWGHTCPGAYSPTVLYRSIEEANAPWTVGLSVAPAPTHTPILGDIPIRESH